jgi:hypothetical protein
MECELKCRHAFEAINTMSCQEITAKFVCNLISLKHTILLKEAKQHFYGSLEQM